MLAYAPDKDVFAIIQMSNVGLSPEGQAHAEAVTRQLVDAAIENGGTYYLTYQLYPTPEQLYRAYPRAREAFERKRFYDPQERFSSQFYERYGHAPTGVKLLRPDAPTRGPADRGGARRCCSWPPGGSSGTSRRTAARWWRLRRGP